MMNDIDPNDEPAPCINCGVRLRNYFITCDECGAQNINYKVVALRKENKRLTKEGDELREALKPFEAFATTTKRMLEMDPDHKITQGSPMAAPQLYARDFLALLAALANTSREPK